MKHDSLMVCPHCRRDFNIRFDGEFGFRFRWFTDCYLIEVVLFFEDWCGWSVLYRDVYIVASGTK
jgi:hypothetical protein